MSDRPILVTGVSRLSSAWNEKLGSRVLICEFETADRRNLVVHFSSGAIEGLGIDPWRLPGSLGPPPWVSN